MISILGGAKIAISLIKQYKVFLQTQSVSDSIFDAILFINGTVFILCSCLFVIVRFVDFMWNSKIINQSFQLDNYLQEQLQETPDKTKFVSPRVLAEGFTSISVVPNADARDAETLAMETLIDAHTLHW